MSQQTFDAFTRQAARAISRRRSLAALGGAGAALAASLAGPTSAGAKESAAKKARKKCKKQAAQCVEFIEDLCEANETDPEDCEETLACCEFLGQCNATAFLQCLLVVR